MRNKEEIIKNIELKIYDSITGNQVGNKSIGMVELKEETEELKAIMLSEGMKEEDAESEIKEIIKNALENATEKMHAIHAAENDVSKLVIEGHDPNIINRVINAVKGMTSEEMAINNELMHTSIVCNYMLEKEIKKFSYKNYISSVWFSKLFVVHIIFNLIYMVLKQKTFSTSYRMWFFTILFHAVALPIFIWLNERKDMAHALDVYNECIEKLGEHKKSNLDIFDESIKMLERVYEHYTDLIISVNKKALFTGFYFYMLRFLDFMHFMFNFRRVYDDYDKDEKEEVYDEEDL